MQVRIKNYLVTATDDQFTLNEVSIVKSGKHEGEEKITPLAYYPKLEQLTNKLFQLDLSKSEAQTLDEMLTVIRATRQLVKTAGWTKEDLLN